MNGSWEKTVERMKELMREYSNLKDKVEIFYEALEEHEAVRKPLEGDTAKEYIQLRQELDALRKRREDLEYILHS